MRLEANKSYEDAEHLYDQLIKVDETNPSYRKRKIAILIGRNDRIEAIKQLNEYLAIFLNDNEAWLQLSELYLKESDYIRSAYSFEDVLLSNPHNSLYLRRMAEIRYTMGTQENIEYAKAYFERAVKLNDEDVRSLMGLILCCNQLAMKCTPQKKKELSTLGVHVAEKLLNVYKSGSDENPSLKIHIIVAQQFHAQMVALGTV